MKRHLPSVILHKDGRVSVLGMTCGGLYHPDGRAYLHLCFKDLQAPWFTGKGPPISCIGDEDQIFELWKRQVEEESLAKYLLDPHE